MSTERGDGSGRPPKVVRLLEKYDLQGLGRELERRWRGEETEQASLRELAAYVNRQLVAVALAGTDLAPFEGDAANLHRLLSTDDVSSGERIRVERRLERAGVDPDRLRDDFVSYQAVRTFLRNRPSLDYERESERASADQVAEQVNQLQSRTAAVTEDKVRRLAAAGELDVGSPRAIVGVDVACDACGEQYEFDELLARDGCGCRS